MAFESVAMFIVIAPDLTLTSLAGLAFATLAPLYAFGVCSSVAAFLVLRRYGRSSHPANTSGGSLPISSIWQAEQNWRNVAEGGI